MTPRLTIGRQVTAPLRVTIAALLGAIAAIHLDLYATHGYRYIPNIGALFLLNSIAGIALAIALLTLPRPLLPAGAGGAGLFAAATLIALLISVNGGLLGFTESTNAPLFASAIGVETATIATSALLAVTARRACQRSRGGPFSTR